MEPDVLFPNERIDDLQLNGMRIIQNSDMFCFGTDAVLLADYASTFIQKNSTVIDLCSGNGIIPILLSQKSHASKIIGIEIQKDSANLAKRSILLNKIDDKVEIICDDLKNSVALFGKSKFDVVTCNPPYKEAGGGLINNADPITIARHEILCSLEDIIRVSSNILKPYGKLCMIHRPERLADIIWHMRNYKIEPKQLRFIHPSANKTATMILIEGTYLGKPKLFLDPPLYMYTSPGVYSEEIHTIYSRRKSDK